MMFQENLATLFPIKRKEAWQRFVDLGLPGKKQELFQYVSLKELYNSTFLRPKEEEKLSQTPPYTLTFHNGKYVENFSSLPKNLIVLPLTQACSLYGNYLIQRLKAQLQEEHDPFAALNGALWEEGLFLYLPPKFICEAPLRIVHVVDCPQAFVSPRIHLFAGKGSFLEIFMEQNMTSEKTFSNCFVDLALEERAEVHLNMILEEKASSWHFDAIRATLKKESRLHAFAISNGAQVFRQDYAIRLMGEYAECSLNGAWKLSEVRSHHVNVLMKHEKPFCTSLQKFKGVLNDFSKSSFEGKIYVSQEADKTSAYQMNHNLILGERAFAYSKPNLEIFASDVKASHGATVGKLNQEDLFYLKTRGIEEKTAKDLLVQGFIGEIVDKIPLSFAKERAKKLIS